MNYNEPSDETEQLHDELTKGRANSNDNSELMGHQAGGYTEELRRLLIFESLLFYDSVDSSLIQKTVAQYLLAVQAVRLRPTEPFTWSSGWKSPIYCDNRVTLAHPEVRSYIKNALARAIRENFPNAEVIAGVATAGIPQGALVADALNLPYCYVRPEPKSHGMGKQIEGHLAAGQRIVVIEDLISTGGSSLKVVDALRAAGAEVLGMAAIFTYGFPIADQNFADKSVSLVCLSNYEALLTEAQALDYIPSEAMESLAAWRQNPAEWGK